MHPLGLVSDFDLTLYELLQFSNRSWFSLKDAITENIELHFKKFRIDLNLEKEQLKHYYLNYPILIKQWYLTIVGRFQMI